jgi:hypothetical protein
LQENGYSETTKHFTIFLKPMKKLLTLVYVLILSYPLLARENPITLKPYGYINHQVVYDTYRSVDTRDGELYFFPRRPVFDVNGNDINKRNKFNMVEVQSRIGLNIAGPDALGARVAGRLEVDFFGTHQENVRLTRLRLAYVAMNWEKTEFLAGIAFHPTFVLDCFPNTISFAAASPFHPLNRSPQIRLKQNLSDNITASVSLITHGYHRSAGPVDAQRNSGLPESQFQVRFGETGDFLFGLTAGYKWLSPRDITAGGLATNKRAGSYNLQAFSRVKTSHLTIKLEGLLGENMTNFFMIGGYGAKSAPDQFDPNDDYDYANLRTLSFWTDIQTNSKPWEFGLFAGYTENLGSKDPYTSLPGLAFFDDIHHLFRFSPRLFYYAGNHLSFGFEFSFYSAVYTETFDQYRKAATTFDPVSNNHIIFQTKYTF